MRAPLGVPDGLGLSGNAFFSGVDPLTLLQMLPAFRMTTLPAGALLFARNQPARRVFLIVRGRVAVVQNTGRLRTTIAVLGPGEFTGERAVLQPALRHVWSAICLEETYVAFADGDALLAASASVPAIGVNVARALHRRVRDASCAIDGLIADP